MWVWVNTYENTSYLVGWTSINPSYFDVNYRGTIGFDTLPCIYHITIVNLATQTNWALVWEVHPVFIQEVCSSFGQNEICPDKCARQGGLEGLCANLRSIGRVPWGNLIITIISHQLSQHRVVLYRSELYHHSTCYKNDLRYPTMPYITYHMIPLELVDGNICGKPPLFNGGKTGEHNRYLGIFP